MTESMIDRAIARLPNLQCADDRCSCSGNERWECIAGVSARDVVIAVFEALKVPTEGMVEAAYEEPFTASAYFDSNVAFVPHTWQAMIEAALSESK